MKLRLFFESEKPVELTIADANFTLDTTTPHRLCQLVANCVIDRSKLRLAHLISDTQPSRQGNGDNKLLILLDTGAKIVCTIPPLRRQELEEVISHLNEYPIVSLELDNAEKLLINTQYVRLIQFPVSKEEQYEQLSTNTIEKEE